MINDLGIVRVDIVRDSQRMQPRVENGACDELTRREAAAATTRLGTRRKMSRKRVSEQCMCDLRRKWEMCITCDSVPATKHKSYLDANTELKFA